LIGPEPDCPDFEAGKCENIPAAIDDVVSIVRLVVCPNFSEGCIPAPGAPPNFVEGPCADVGIGIKAKTTMPAMTAAIGDIRFRRIEICFHDFINSYFSGGPLALRDINMLRFAKAVVEPNFPGHSLSNWAVRAMSALPTIATELWTLLEVRFVPTGDINDFA
jgi:hypothetical protein